MRDWTKKPKILGFFYEIVIILKHTYEDTDHFRIIIG